MGWHWLLLLPLAADAHDSNIGILILQVNQSTLKQLQESFSAVRGKSDEDRSDCSLFKVHLSVVCGLKDGSRICAISPGPIRDKNKHEFKGLTPTPRAICDSGRNVITVLMENSKVNLVNCCVYSFHLGKVYSKASSTRETKNLQYLKKDAIFLIT